MSSAVVTPGTNRLPVRQSQWAMIWREFCKRRLALGAGFVLIGLITASVYAPFLANDRPVYFYGVNRFEFREMGRNLRGVIGQLVNSSQVTNKQDLVRSARLQLELMNGELQPDGQLELQALRDRVETALTEPDELQFRAKLRSLQPDLRKAMEVLEPKQVVRGSWPVLQSLRAAEVGFMVGILLFLTFPAWRRWTRSRRVDAGPRNEILVLCLIPGLCAAAWWLFPARMDRTDYKSGVLAADDADHKAAVVYHSVIWPPIVYAIDEYDLAGKSEAPVWYPASWRPNKPDMIEVLKSEVAEEPRNPMAAGMTRTSRKSPWNTAHWLGTDESGRDVTCRMIWGGRVSLSVGIVAVAIYVFIGIIVGALAGYFRGVWDLLISRIIEIVICFPSFFLILTIVAMVGPGLLNIMVVIGLTGWTGVARLVRGEFLRLVDQEFVLAGKALGYSPMRLIFRHVLPNAMAPVLVSATFGIAGAILMESALSFLGLGISSPTPSWGSLLADGRNALIHAPWLIHFPGLAIFITITSYNLIGEALRDAADPRLRGSR